MTNEEFQGSEDIIPPATAHTLYGLFRERVRRTPEAVAYRWFSKPDDAWLELSWNDMAARVARWQAALQAEGLKAGDRVAIQLRNGPDWVVFDQAALGLGLVVVPLYTDDRPDNAAFVVRDARASLLLVQSGKHWEQLAPALAQQDHLARVVVLEGEADARDDRVRTLDAWLPAGGQVLAPVTGAPEDLASIVYTSGTTGRPKGVMLSHFNMLAVSHAALTMLDVYQEDLFLSFLPLSHTLERTGGYYLPMMAGSTVAYARSIALLGDDLLQLRPSILIAVPRIFERVYGRIQDQLSRGPLLRRLLFRLAVRVGWRRFEYRQGRAHWTPVLMLWPLLERLVARRILERLGGRIRAAVSGGAALPLPVAQTFIGLGLPLLQGYGLTETSPVISVNLFEDNDPASVGVPIRGTEVRIGDQDELLARGPGVMLGYWNNHAATRQMIDTDGWLHTGDQARIENNHIYITGRLKDILVLSNGEKVPPGDMESALTLDSLIEQAMVVGEGRSYLSAILVLNGEHWVRVAKELALDPFDEDSLQDERLHRYLLSLVRERLHDFPGYAKIRRLVVTLEAWSVENDLLTPTLKVKRGKVLQQFQAEIDVLYTGS